FESQLGALARIEFVRNLNQHTGAVAGLGVAAARAAVRQIQQHLDSLQKNVVALLAPDTRHKPDPAGIVLLRRIVQTLRRRHAILRLHAGHYSVSWEKLRPRIVLFLDSSQRLRAQPTPHSKPISSIL